MIERFLCDRLGLSYESLGRRNVEKAVSAMMARHGFSDEAEYVEFLRGSPGHFDELAHSMLIPETWFFRYGESFAFLAKHAKEHLAASGRPIHVLSIPCSTGEEPYSIAMTLVDSDVTPHLIHIDAADASGTAIETAKEGSYGPNSFRGGIPEPMLKYFRAHGARHEIAGPIRSLVKFRKVSIFDHDFTRGRPVYDIIFCRNMLIYFSAEKQARALEILSGMLTEDALLFLGHAESGMLNRDEFTSARYSSSFAFRRKTGSAGGHHPSSPGDEARTAAHKRASIVKPCAEAKKIDRPHPAPAESPADRDVAHDKDKILMKASEMADKGELKGAEELCLRYLQHDKLNPYAYYVLGVIGLSSGRLDDAEKSFNKAIYLNPDYYEALVQLALLKDKQGDRNKASMIRRRAERATALVKQ